MDANAADEQPEPKDLTRLLHRVSGGDPAAAEQVYKLVEQELRNRANRFVTNDGILQSTMLVNDAYMRILQSNATFENRNQFYTYAARAIRSVFVDYLRSKKSQKRCPIGLEHLDRVVLSYENRALDLLLLDEALDEFAEADPKMAKAVELHFFAGLNLRATAEACGIPQRTFARNWARSLDWLYTRLS